jgi:hypothetical protein
MLSQNELGCKGCPVGAWKPHKRSSRFSRTRGEEVVSMKGSRGILALLAIVILVAAMPAWSQQPYSKVVSKSISPGRTQIRFESIVYSFTTQGTFSVEFESVDPARVRLTLKPIKPEYAPYPALYVQWESFGAVSLIVTGPSGDTYTLNTETGYAEK